MVSIRKTFACGVERQRPVLGAMHVFGLELEVALDRVSVRRPLPHQIQSPHVAVPGKGVGNWDSNSIHITVGTVLCLGGAIAGADPITSPFADVITDMEKHHR